MKYHDQQTRKINVKWSERPEYQFDMFAHEKRYAKKFKLKVYKYVEREWWDSLHDYQQKSAIRDWVSIVGVNKKSDFKSWILKYRMENKPDITIYREKILNNLLK